MTTKEAWAPYGYARLVAEVQFAEGLLAEKKLKQSDVDAATARLNAILNIMRPSNLAEPEDLKELLALVDKAKATENPSPKLLQAIKYADMVIAYVNDGSGTHDMIRKAEESLK